MSKSASFPFLSINQSASVTDLMPFLPLRLSREVESVEVLGLVDSGATINVLPYQIGLSLGAVWEDQLPLFRLGGNLANYESRGLILTAQIADFEPVNLAFAWTKAEEVPVILGQTNFFSTFDVCFFRQDTKFEIKVR